MTKHIVCFGDSNTHGYRAMDGKRFEEERWTRLLQKELGEEYQIVEEGLGGRTTCFQDPIREGLSGIDYITPCLMSHEPVDLLIIMLGTNDTKQRFGVTPACIGLGMRRLVKKAIATDECWRNGKPEILIVTPKNIEKEYEKTEVVKTMGTGCAEKSEGLASQFEAAARELGCHYLDANPVVSGQNHIDYMHLTGEGHRELAGALSQLIPEILKS